MGEWRLKSPTSAFSDFAEKRGSNDTIQIIWNASCFGKLLKLLKIQIWQMILLFKKQTSIPLIEVSTRIQIKKYLKYFAELRPSFSNNCSSSFLWKWAVLARTKYTCPETRRPFSYHRKCMYDSKKYFFIFLIIYFK